MALRSECMIVIEQWSAGSDMALAEAASRGDITQPRFHALLEGAIEKLSLDAPADICARAGLQTQLRVTALRERKV